MVGLVELRRPRLAGKNESFRKRISPAAGHHHNKTQTASGALTVFAGKAPFFLFIGQGTP